MEHETLDERVAALERGSRRLARWGCAVAIVVVACVGVGWSSAERVGASLVERSQRFELVDKDGAVVGVLGTDKGFYPYVEMWRDGTQGAGGRVRLEVPWSGGPRMSMTDAAGAERVRVYLGGRLAEGEIEGKPVRVVAGQIPHVLLFDDEHRVRGAFASTNEGAVKLELRDSSGKVRFSAKEE